ncbi:hypothetical protein AB1Y20_005963 [Prymnesium parvum]|uniref:Fe2OG dioxygenase domain-containing protein n=1 Tax=Prymnesium parvum TaxID=97485 RepID=A0AB34J3I8_PRYPA
MGSGVDPSLHAACEHARKDDERSRRREAPRVCTANSLARYWADDKPYVEDTEVVALPSFLSAADIEELAMAVSLGGKARNAGWASLSSTLQGVPHDVAFSDVHVALYLHRDGYFQTSHRELFCKCIAAMREQASSLCDPKAPLHVRCIEFHTYAEGGGLIEPDHRDNGSVLTMSALVSNPRDTSGGHFVTFSFGQPVVHELSRGDALLFSSERLHNVSTVAGGQRCALVIELWVQPTNSRDRFS